MSHETSPSTQQPYGIARVTRLWQVPRSTVYARRARRDHPPCEAKRGPKTRWTDAELTARIRTILAESPFHGEGHRKIWARLRAQGVRTSKRRTLVVMRAANLLGPARLPAPVVVRPHDGTIVTTSPNVMWGTDATVTVTLADGQVTIFGGSTAKERGLVHQLSVESPVDHVTQLGQVPVDRSWSQRLFQEICLKVFDWTRQLQRSQRNYLSVGMRGMQRGSFPLMTFSARLK